MWTITFVGIDDLKPDMLVAKEVRDKNNWLLLRTGIRLTATQIEYLRKKGVEGVSIGEERKRTPLKEDAPTLQCRVHVQRAVHEYQKQCEGQRLSFAPLLFEALSDILVSQLLLRPGAVMAALEMFDWHKTLFQHSVNTAVLAMLAARKQGFDLADCQKLALGMFFHDFGSLQLPREIFEKTSPLTPEEKEIVRNHPRLGYEELTLRGVLDEDAAQVVLSHHERFDGSGYPFGYSEGDLSPLTRIAMVVEVYDSMVSPRLYGRPVQPEQAIKNILQNVGTLYDRSAALSLAQSVPVYPVGNAVCLNTGECGLVSEVEIGSAMRPKIRVYYSAEGRRISPYEVNTSVDTDKWVSKAASTIDEVKPSPSDVPAALLQRRAL